MRPRVSFADSVKKKRRQGVIYSSPPPPPPLLIADDGTSPPPPTIPELRRSPSKRYRPVSRTHARSPSPKQRRFETVDEVFEVTGAEELSDREPGEVFTMELDGLSD